MSDRIKPECNSLQCHLQIHKVPDRDVERTWDIKETKTLLLVELGGGYCVGHHKTARVESPVKVECRNIQQGRFTSHLPLGSTAHS